MYHPRTLVCWEARMLGNWDAAICYKPSATLEPFYHPQTLVYYHKSISKSARGKETHAWTYPYW
jgi:hypothetical protein